MWGGGASLPSNRDLNTIKLPNLKNIKTIAPYIALDNQGRVYVWDLDQKKSKISDDAPADFIRSAVYTAPKEIPQLKNVTHIASEGRLYFLAAAGGINLYEGIRKQSGISIPEQTAVQFKLINSRPGIQAIATSSEAAVAIYSDGFFFGWPRSIVGRYHIKYPEGYKYIRSFPFQARSINFSTNQTSIVLVDKRIAYISDGCNLAPGLNQEWHLMYNDSSNNPVTNIISMDSDSNSEQPSVLVMDDGTIWITNTYRGDLFKEDCGRSVPFSFQQLTGMTVPAIKAVIGTGLIYALGSDHSLWTTNTLSDNGVINKFVKLEGP